MKEEQHIQDIFNTLRELPPEVDLAGIEQFVLAQPVTAFQPPAGGDGGTSGLLTIKNTIIMISSISIIGSVALFIGGGSDKPSAATASVTDTPVQQTLVLDSAPVLVENTAAPAAALPDDVVSVPHPVSTYPYTPNWDSAYPSPDVRYGAVTHKPVAAPAQPELPVNSMECDDEKHVAGSFVREMLRDGLIDSKHFSFTFDHKELNINNRRQPELVYGKYRELFERQSGQPVSQGTLLVTSLESGHCSSSLSQSNGSSHGASPKPVQGSGVMRELEPFSSVVFAGIGHLHIQAGATYSIEITSEDESRVKTEIKDGVLLIGTQGKLKAKNSGNFTLTLPEDKLRRASVTGIGTIEFGSEFNGIELLSVDGQGSIIMPKHLSTPELRTSVTGSGGIHVGDVVTKRTYVSVPGSGSVTISGLSDNVNVSIGGSGSAELEELHTQVATCDIDGSGSILITVDRELRISISGSGVITYSGSPSITQNITGSGIVEKKK